jgi:hypothetical protein
LADYIGDMASWQKEPSLWYWYDQWIVVGVSMAIAGISVVFDGGAIDDRLIPDTSRSFASLRMTKCLPAASS